MTNQTKQQLMADISDLGKKNEKLESENKRLQNVLKKNIEVQDNLRANNDNKYYDMDIKNGVLNMMKDQWKDLVIARVGKLEAEIQNEINEITCEINDWKDTAEDHPQFAEKDKNIEFWENKREALWGVFDGVAMLTAGEPERIEVGNELDRLVAKRVDERKQYN